MANLPALLTQNLQIVVIGICVIFLLAAVLAAKVNPRRTRKTWVYNRYTDTWSEVESK